MNHWARAAKKVNLLRPVSAANTAAATSSWVDIREAEGDIVISVDTGAVTGTITWTVEHATADDGTGGAAFTPDDGAFTAGSANQTQKRVINASALNGYLRVVGTIGTGPSLVSANIIYQANQPA